MSQRADPTTRTPIELSVIVCSHNPRADFLRRTLAGLRAQTLALARWEFILVDNASDQPLVTEWDLSWHPNARHVREEKKGLTPARLRGIREAKGDLLLFVDDDNELAPDFLSETIRVATEYPYLGVFGAGVLVPEFEVEPPPELKDRVRMLALRTVSEVVWSGNPRDFSCMPFGAGMCVTRQVGLAYERLLDALGVSDVVDRQGQRLFSGGDDLFSWAAAGIGLGFGLFPRLRLTHLIGASRLELPYFLRLTHDHIYSHAVLKFRLSGTQPRRIDFFRLVRVMLHFLRNGRYSAQCQWAALKAEDQASRFLTTKCLEPLPPLSTIMQSVRPASLSGRAEGSSNRLVHMSVHPVHPLSNLSK